MKVWVLSWRYSDGSASGILRAYFDKGRALEDLALMDGDALNKKYELIEAPVYGKEERTVKS